MTSFWRAACLLAAASLGAVDLSVVPDPLPGLATDSQSIRIEASHQVQVEYRFLEDVDRGFLPWTGPLLLSALPGETRPYTLRVQSTLPSGESLTRDFRYTISRPAVARPTIAPSPGYFARAVTVDARLPAGRTASLGGRPATFPLTLPGVPGELKTYRIDVTGAQGRDDGVTWTYAIDLRDQRPRLDVLSPQPGVWAHAQTLALSFEGLERVSWNWGDAWTDDGQRTYTGPVALPGAGELVLTVRGLAKGSGEAVQRTVRWTQSSEPTSSWGLPDPGTLRQALVIPATPGVDASFDEGHTWRSLGEPRTEPLLPQGLKVIAVWYRKNAQLSRALYWMDGRTPAVPQLEVWGGWNPRLAVSAGAGSWLTVEWASAKGAVTTSEGAWGPTASWKIPDGVVSATVVSTLPGGANVRSVAVAVPEVGWSRPEWTPWESGGGTIAPRKGFLVAYEVGSDRDVPEPTSASPTLTGPFLPSVPLGVDRTLFARFAWRDEAGVVGPSTPVIAVRVDHQPPRPPRVTVNRRLLTVEPADAEPGARLFYAVTSARLGPSEAPLWVPLAGTLDLDQLPPSTGPQWVHALVVDAAGNPGSPRLNFPLGTGNAAYEWKGLSYQDVAHGTSGTVGDTVVLGSPKVVVAPQWDGDVSGAGFHLASASEVPTNDALERYDVPLVLTAGSGERRTFVTWWNLKNASGWIWSSPRRITVTLDQGSALDPSLVGWDTPTVRPQAWTLSATVGQPGDRLWYTATRDGPTPGDPTGPSAQEWPGSLTFDTPDGTRSRIQVRLSVASASGQAREVGSPRDVVIDKTTPAALPPLAEPYRSVRNPTTLVLGPYDTPVRYTLSRDGSVPEVPSLQSPLLEQGRIDLPGEAGHQTLYRLRLRPFSSAGQPGPVSDGITVLVDRTQTDSATTAPEGSGGLRVTGLPASGLTSQPVTVQISSAWGTAHFELSEGPVGARSVDATSPVAGDTLTLEGVDGADRTYSLAVRAFVDDQPVTPESRWTLRIDRSRPAAPTLSLEADARRPEALVRFDTSSLAADEHLSYRWTWSSFPEGAGQLDWTPAADEPPRFVAPGGLLTSLTVEAQVTDDAGNRGEVASASLLLDRNVVYASAQAGASGLGTRDDPAGDLRVALQKLRTEGRKILLLTSGTYALSSAQDWTGFQVWGGLKVGTWEATASPGRSLVVPQRGTTLSQLLEVYGDLALHRVDLSDAGETLGHLVLAQGASVSLDDSTWQARGTTTPWVQNGGSLRLRGNTVLWDGGRESSLFHLSDVVLQVKDSRWTVQNGTNLRLLAIVGGSALLSGLTMTTRDGRGYEHLVVTDHTDLVGSNLKFQAGPGPLASVGFVLNDGRTTLSSVEVSQSAQQGNTGYQVTGGQLDLAKVGHTIATGTEFNVVLRLQNATATVFESSFQVLSGSYQGGVTQNGGRLSLGSTKVTLAGGGQRAWGLQTLGSCWETLTNVSWVLNKKTPGAALLAQQTWLVGSTDTAGSAQGW